MNERPTPETDALDERLKQDAENMMRRGSSYSDIIKQVTTALYEHTLKLERERDEAIQQLARVDSELSKYVIIFNEVEEERNQLRKVADELASHLKRATGFFRMTTEVETLEAYNNLPHVKERK